MQKTRNAALLRLCYDALLAALYVVLSVFATVKIPNVVEISWASLPVLLAALLFGLPDAVTVAVCGSFLEQLLSPYGLSPTTVLWMAPVILQALLAGGLAPLVRGKGGKGWYVVIIVLSELVLTVTNTAALYLDARILGYTVKALVVLLPTRLVNGLARTVLSALLVPALMLPLERALRAAGVRRACAFALPAESDQAEEDDEEWQ